MVFFTGVSIGVTVGVVLLIILAVLVTLKVCIGLQRRGATRTVSISHNCSPPQLPYLISQVERPTTSSRPPLSSSEAGLVKESTFSAVSDQPPAYSEAVSLPFVYPSAPPHAECV